MSDTQILLKERYDAVIIGSGPAGASAAKALSGHGLNTLIIEKDRLPRYKMCSGILAPTSVKFVHDHFGTIPDSACSSPVDVIGFSAHPSIGSPILDIPLAVMDKGPGLPEIGMSVKRAEFDHWLCSGSDAQIVDQCRFKGIDRQDQETMLVLDLQGQEQKIRAGYLVGADGPLSRVRKSINPDFNNTLRMIPNYEEWYVGDIDLRPEWLHMFYDKRLTSYFATVFHKDGKVIVVTGAKQPESPKDYFGELVNYLKTTHSLVIKEKTATCGCVLHDMSATDNFYLGDGHILLTGEAGGFNRCAEGISSALVTGKAAGEAILKSLGSGKPALEYYSEAALPEIEACKRASAAIEDAIGLNPFTR